MSTWPRLQNNLLTRFPIPNVILSTSSLVKYSRMETIILSTVERISLEASWQTSNKRKPGKRGRKFFKNFLSPPFVCPRTVALQFYRANSVARSFSISRAVYLSYFPLLSVPRLFRRRFCIRDDRETIRLIFNEASNLSEL